VLQRLGHVGPDGLVQIKGRAACEIDAADELMCTELMFNGTFRGLDAAKLVALTSCFVPAEKSNVRGPAFPVSNTVPHLSCFPPVHLSFPESEHALSPIALCLLRMGWDPQVALSIMPLLLLLHTNNGNRNEWTKKIRKVVATHTPSPRTGNM
jgi:hypothetical protein